LFYALRPPDETNYEIHATHPWGLPGVRCDVCGQTWSNTGTSYPTVDLSGLPNAKRYKNLWPVSRAELDALRQPIAPLLPPGAPLPPGTDLGPLKGRITGVLSSHIAWHQSWDVLFDADVYRALNAIGSIRLTGAAANLRSRRPVSLIEIQAERHGRMAAVSLPPGGLVACDGCGRRGVKRPDKVVLDGESLASAPDLFRLDDLTTAIVASHALVTLVRSLGLTGAAIEELAIA
jgi:uncharacterized double-CXXCG motif protein